MKRYYSLIVIVLVGFVTISCAATGYQRYNTQGGALVGAALGAGLGQAIGGNTAGTLIGAGGGALLGALLGNAMDQNQAEYGYSPYNYGPIPPPAYGQAEPYAGENPPGEWVTVPGRWVGGRWVPAHRVWVPVNP